MPNPNEKKDFEELADMIDACMGKGSGHLNVKAGEIDEIKNVMSISCEGGACSVPTLHKDIDDE